MSAQLKTSERENKMTEDKVTAEVDPNGIDQSYKFLNALLDDYNACKTELARSGISKAFKMLLDQIGKDHAGLACKFIELKKELEATKAKLPKTKEEITKILHEVGLSDLEECEDGNGIDNVPSRRTIPTGDLTPIQHGNHYRRLYGEMTKADLKKIDQEVRKLEKEEPTEKVEISEKAIELCNSEDSSKNNLLVETKKPEKTDEKLQKPSKKQKQRSRSNKKSSKNKA